MLTLPPALLTLPAPGERTFAGVTRKLRLLALRRLLTQTVAGPSGLVRGAAGLRQALVEAARRDKSATLAILASPDVLVPVLCLEAGIRPAEIVLASVGPTLLALLSEGGLLRDPVMWEHPVASVVLSDRAWSFDPPAAAMAALPSGAEVQLADGSRHPLAELPPARPFHTLRQGVVLATLDTNPLAMVEAHPDKQGNAVSLGDHPLDEWVESLRDALDIVAAALPEWQAELPLSLSRLVPVGYLPEVHLSASYREAPGLAYLTLHPSRLTLAEAVVHETQHGRLNCLTWLDPVLRNGWTEWTPSPVRPDLRPLMGVLLAVHAFVPVAALHARMADQAHPLARGPDFERRRVQVLAGNQRGLEILQEKSETTPIGRRMLDELQRLHDALAALRPTGPPLATDTLPPG